MMTRFASGVFLRSKRYSTLQLNISIVTKSTVKYNLFTKEETFDKTLAICRSIYLYLSPVMTILGSLTSCDHHSLIPQLLRPSLAPSHLYSDPSSCYDRL